MDFTLTIYRRLLTALQDAGYAFQPFAEFIAAPKRRAVVLRHDIDKLPANALRMAQLEHDLGARGSYYFRVIPAVWDEAVMKQVVGLGHELGYHYEDLSLFAGDHAQAIRHFEQQLERFRRIAPVTTICMHGSPLSRHDNRDLWEHYDYRTFGVDAEPYFDVDFNRVFYVTDTGRTWKDTAASVRDRVDTTLSVPITGTEHFIARLRMQQLPEQMMITIHPQRWHDRPVPWLKELVGQKSKNVVKTALSKIRSWR